MKDQLPILLEELKSPDPIIRAAAARALGKYPVQVAEFVASLAEEIASGERKRRVEAARELTELIPDAAATIEGLRHEANLGLKDPTIATLKLMVGGGEPAAKGLLDALSDPEMNVQLAAIDALGAVGRYAHPAIPALTALLGVDRLEAKAKVALAAIGAGYHSEIPGLTPLLSAQDERVRIGAALAVAEIRRLRFWESDSNAPPTERADAVAFLDQLDSMAYRAVTPLAAILSNASGIEEEAATTALQWLSPLAGTAARQFVESKRHQDAAGADRAMEILESFSASREFPWEELQSRLGAVDPESRRSTIARLEEECRKIAPFARQWSPPGIDAGAGGASLNFTAFLIVDQWVDTILPALATAVADEDAFVRSGVARCFQGLLEAALGNSSGWNEGLALMRELDDDLHLDEVFDEGFLDKLGVQNVLSSEHNLRAVVGGLERLLRDPAVEVRRSAAAALTCAGALAAGATAALAKSLKDRDAVVRRSSISALKRLGRRGRTAVPLLIELLTSDDNQERLLAIDTLAAMRHAANTAAAPLATLTSEKDGAVALRAALALAMIDPSRKEGLGVLAIAMRDADGSARFDAACALSRIAPATEGLIDVLLAAMGDAELHSRCRAMDALARLGAAAAPAAPVLLEYLASPERPLQSAAIRALMKIGPAAEAIVPNLCELIDGGESAAPNFATMALMSVGKNTSDSVPALLKAFANPQSEIAQRNVAALALGEMGDVAVDAVPELIRALDNPAMRRVTVMALGQIPSAETALSDWIQSHDSLSESLAAAMHSRGKIHLIQDDHSKAIEDLTQAIRLSTENADAYYDRASASLCLGDLDAVIADVSELLAIDPSHVMGLSLRGEAYRRKADYANALTDLNAAMRDFTWSSALNWRAIVYKRLGRLAEALADYDEAIRKEPSNTQYYCNRALAYVAAGEYSKAIDDYETALAIDSADFKASCSLAWLLSTCADEAIRDGARAVKLALESCSVSEWANGDCIDTLAAAYAEIGEFAQAIEAQERALQLPAFAEESGAGARLRLAAYQSGQPHREVRGQAC